MTFVKVPKDLDRLSLEREFGTAAVEFYFSRIAQREREGKVYYNPLKTIYLWATADRNTNQGYYTSFRGFSNGRKRRNYGGS